MTSFDPARVRLQVANGEAFDVRSFEVNERMNAPFSVSLGVMSPNPDLDLELMVGEAARFEIGGRRSWVGILRALELVRAEPAGLSSYRVSLAPRLWLLSQRRNHRVFQRMSELEIASQLLTEWGIPFEARVDRRSHLRREYRVQYAESDFAFFSRMVEDAGVAYWHECHGGKAVLVLSDSPTTADPIGSLQNVDDASTPPATDFATRLSVARELRPARYTLSDIDHRRPASVPLQASSNDAGATALESTLESFHYVPGAFLYEGDTEPGSPVADAGFTARTSELGASALAARRVAAKRGGAHVFGFSTNALQLGPGSRVTIVGHPRSDLGESHPLLVTSIRVSGEATGRWEIACQARGSAVAFRPELATPKPRVSGVEIATVVGPAGDEIHTDEFGRVRVHFRWDRQSRMDEKSSCWVPVSQPWAGAGYGGMNLPRVGQEVVVDFVGGDPDRPLVVGRVYSATQVVPFKLPDNKTQSGWRSNSTNATGGFNEIMFEDNAGQELFRMQAERDLHRLIKNDEENAVGRDQSTTVANNRSMLVGGTERVQIGRNQSLVVGVNRSTNVGVVDATVVGETHVVMIAPPGEQGPAASSSTTMTDKKIVLDTGAGARITLEKDRIKMEAEVIEILARDYVEIRGEKKGVVMDAPKGGNTFSGKSFNVHTDDVTIGGKRVSVYSAGPAEVSAAGTLEVSGGAVDIAGAPVVINGPGPNAARAGDAVGGVVLQGSATVFIGGGASALGPFATPEAAAKAAMALARQRAEATGDFDFIYEGVVFVDPATGKIYASDPSRIDYYSTKEKSADQFGHPLEMVKGKYQVRNEADGEIYEDIYAPQPNSYP